MRIATARLRLAVMLAVLAAAPALAQSSSVPADASSEPQSTVPEELLGMVGDWMLEQQDETLPQCPVRLTDQETIGGWAIELPETCPAPYPVANSFFAWNVDPTDGSIYFLDPERHVTMRLFEDEDGLYDTDPNVEPRFYLMAPYDPEGAGGEADSD
jgi:hypothetical protein